MKFTALKDFGSYKAGQTYTVDDQDQDVRRALQQGNAREVPAAAGDTQRADTQRGAPTGKTESGQPTDGKTVFNPGGQRGSVGAQQQHPQKGEQVREAVSGERLTDEQRAEQKRNEEQQRRGSTDDPNRNK